MQSTGLLAIIDVVVAVLALILVTGCQVKGKSPLKGSGKTASVQVRFPNSSAVTTSYHASTGGYALTIPSNLGDFDCFAVNVVASDIKGVPVCGGSSKMGAVSGFVPRGGTLELNVPIGKDRTFQIWGFAHSDHCSDVVNLLSTPNGSVPGGYHSAGFILGEQTIDVLQAKMNVAVPVRFTLGVNQTMCGTLPTPTTTITQVTLGPPVPTITLANNDITSSSLDACVYFNSTADNPSFTCYADGSPVTCSSSSTCPLLGTTGVYRFPVTLPDSSHTFRIETLDAAYGTQDPHPPSFTWTVDTTAPVASIAPTNPITPGGAQTATDYFTNSTRPTVSLSVSNLLVREATTAQVEIDGSGVLITCGSAIANGLIACVLPTLTVGAHTITYYVTDVALNTTTIGPHNLTVESTIPTLTIAPTDGWLWGGDLTSAASPAAAIPTAADTDAINTSTLTCSVNSVATACTSGSPFTFTKGGRQAIVMNVKDYATNSATQFSQSAYVDSLFGLPVLGRLNTDLTWLQDESASTTVVGNQPLDNGFGLPEQMALDTSSGYLYVADASNNRVLVFSWNTSTNRLVSAKAVAVFGQNTFLTTDSGSTNTATHTPMNSPSGIALSSSPKKLFVSDTQNNRILRFDISTGNANKIADAVFGQTDDTTNGYNHNTNMDSTNVAANLTQGFYNPYGLYYASTTDKLYVADYNNCRVGIIDTAAALALGSDPSLSVQLGANGQALAAGTTWVCDGSTTDAQNMYHPTGLVLDTSSNILYVADKGLNRVLSYASASALTTATAATSAIGQPDLITSTAGDDNVSTLSQVTGPVGVATVTDSNSTKYLAVTSSNGGSFSKIKFILPSTNTTSAIWNTSGVSASSKNALNNPGQLLFSSTASTLFVSDLLNYRVALFSTLSITNDLAMYDVIGHVSADGVQKSYMAGAQNNPNDGKYNAATYAAADVSNLRLYVSDTGNNRVLVYNLDPTTLKPTSTTAASVLGQSVPAFNGNALLDTLIAPILSANTLSSPKGLAVDAAGRLWVADSGNNRVLRFQTNSSISPGTVADLVLGQADLSLNAAGTAAADMTAPTGLAYDVVSDRLFVTDTGNFTIKVFANLSSATNGIAPDNTIAHQDPGLVAADVASNPTGIAFTTGVAGVVNTGIFVADSGNNRVNYYDLSAGIPAAATACYGHRAAAANDYVTMCAGSAVNDGGTLAANGAWSLNTPMGVSFSEATSTLYVSDSSNNRVVAYDFTSTFNRPSNTTVTNLHANTHVMGARDQATVLGGTTATPAAFNAPQGLFRLAPSGGTNLLYIVDPGWHRLGVYEVP